MLAAKLAAVVAGHTGDAPTRPGTYPLGAALREAERAWVLLDETVDDGTGLGPAIAWALRSGSVALNVVADAPAHGRRSAGRGIRDADSGVGAERP